MLTSLRVSVTSVKHFSGFELDSMRARFVYCSGAFAYVSV